MTTNLQDYLSENNITFNDLFIFSRLYPDQVKTTLGVTDRTLRRWKQTGRYPDRAMKLMASRAGYFIHPDWIGYRIATDGRLYHPEYKDGLTSGQVQSLWYIARNTHHFKPEKSILESRAPLTFPGSVSPANQVIFSDRHSTQLPARPASPGIFANSDQT